MLRDKLLLIALLTGFLSGTVSPAHASILTFDITDLSDPALYPVSENFPEGFTVDQTYGDRVISTSVTVGNTKFEYGNDTEGFTPNVVVEYGPYSIYTGGPSLWRYNYGNLVRVLYQGSTYTGLGNDYAT